MVEYDLMIQEDCTITDHKQVSQSFFKLTIHSKYISSHAIPGQFVEIRVTDSTIPLLRKPFSIHKIDPAKQTIDIFYEVLGTGTALLSQKKIGETINALGPLGNGFEINKDKKIFLLVGGGMGVAPLAALAQSLIQAQVKVFIGAQTSGKLNCVDEFKQLGIEPVIASDDGSLGKKGLVSDILLNFLENDLKASDSRLATIFACGPHAMLKTVAEIAQQYQIDCKLSMEAYMACGIGACKGCAIETKSGYKMVCKDGPVFDSKEIIWN